MKRRKFIVSSGLTLAGSAALANGPGFPKENPQSTSKILPKSLKEGDTIGVITPGSGLMDGQFEKIGANLKKIGLKPKYSKNLRAHNGFLAGKDEERLQDLHEMFADPTVKGIICGRGGYGSARILEDIDYDLIRRNPKVLVGYSDITALIVAIYKKTGLVCYHGPVGASEFSAYTTENFKSILINQQGTKNFGANRDYFTISEGSGSGELVGGNLSIVVSLLGTTFEPDFKDKILFIEEVGEKPYRIDRMLTQLLMAGKLQQTKAIVMGNWVNCDVPRGTSSSYSLKQVLNDRLKPLGIPCAYGFKIGHTDDNSTIPYGIKATFDATSKKLTLLENPVA